MLSTQKLIIILATSTLITACGGGGGSDENPTIEDQASTNTTPTQTPIVQTPVVQTPIVQTPIVQTQIQTPVEPQPPTQETPVVPQVTRTSDLTAAEDFGFTSSYDIDLSINLADMTKRYLNVCHGFSDDMANPAIDYDTCVLKTPLENSQYTSSISLTNNITKLVIAIWSFDGNDPQYYYWDRSSQGDVITIDQ